MFWGFLVFRRVLFRSVGKFVGGRGEALCCVLESASFPRGPVLFQSPRGVHSAAAFRLHSQRGSQAHQPRSLLAPASGVLLVAILSNAILENRRPQKPC